MVQAGYTTDRLLQIGRSNYDRLCLFCENLERSGLWEQARQVMKQSAKMILDRYVQSVLVTFAAAEGIVTESEREYIAIITDSNLLAVSPEIPVNGELIEADGFADFRRCFYSCVQLMTMNICSIPESSFWIPLSISFCVWRIWWIGKVF